MKVIVDFDNENLRLDNFSSKVFSISRTQAQKLIENGKILVNNEIKKTSYKVQVDDFIDYEKEEEIVFEPKPKDIKLDILYEDDDLIVLNKQKGLICHPTTKNEEDTLVSALLFHTKNLSDVQGKIRQGIVHRLDKDTSGLMLVAKNNKAHQKLQEDIKSKKTVRKYLAVCYGVIKDDFGIIDKPLIHNMDKTVKMTVNELGLDAVTEYKVLERFENATFLELKLQTGRTHQIRCHMSSLNHPVVGDDLYGAKGFKRSIFKNFKTQGQVLMSYYLSFTHPTTGEIMEFEIKEENYHIDLIRTLNLLRSLK